MNQFDFTCILIAILIVSVLYYIDKKKGMRFYEPVQLFLAGWFVSLGLLLANFVTYEAVFSIVSFSVTVIFIFMFWLGSMVGFAHTKYTSKVHIDLERIELSKSSLKILVLLTLTGAALSFQEIMAKISSISVVGLSGVRGEHWDSLQSAGGIGIVRVIGSVFNSCAFILALYLPIAVVKRERFRIAICIATFIYLVLQTFAFGGRAVMTYLVFIYLIAFLINWNYSSRSSRRKVGVTKKLFKYGLTLLFGLIFMYLLFGYFSAARNVHLIGRYDVFLGYQQHAWLSDWLVEYFGNYDSILSFAYGMTYFTSPLPGFTTLMKYESISSAYYFGVQSFDVIAKAVHIIFRENIAANAASDIASALVRDGLFSTNPWATSIRDFVMDFGIVGAFVIAFFIGLICTYIVRKHLGSIEYSHNTLALVIMLCAFVMSLRGPFNLTIVSNTLVLLGVLTWVAKMRENGNLNKAKRAAYIRLVEDREMRYYANQDGLVLRKVEARKDALVNKSHEENNEPCSWIETNVNMSEAIEERGHNESSLWSSRGMLAVVLKTMEMTSQEAEMFCVKNNVNIEEFYRWRTVFERKNQVDDSGQEKLFELIRLEREKNMILQERLDRKNLAITNIAAFLRAKKSSPKTFETHENDT